MSPLMHCGGRLEDLVTQIIPAGAAAVQFTADDASQAANAMAEEQQPPPSILRQTEAALDLWEHLHVTASTPSTVLPPATARTAAAAAVSASTDQSAA
jgi:hypothetical protein